MSLPGLKYCRINAPTLEQQTSRSRLLSSHLCVHSRVPIGVLFYHREEDVYDGFQHCVIALLAFAQGAKCLQYSFLCDRDGTTRLQRHSHRHTKLGRNDSAGDLVLVAVLNCGCECEHSAMAFSADDVR